MSKRRQKSFIDTLCDHILDPRTLLAILLVLGTLAAVVIVMIFQRVEPGPKITSLQHDIVPVIIDPDVDCGPCPLREFWDTVPNDAISDPRSLPLFVVPDLSEAPVSDEPWFWV